MFKQYFIKDKGNIEGNRDYLSNGEIILEKIAYDILALLGVHVPSTCLVEKNFYNNVKQLAIASEYNENNILLKNTILHDYTFDGETPNFIYEQTFINSQCVIDKEKTLPIVGLFESLPSIIILMDLDALGETLANGLLKIENEQATFIKLDPGQADLFQGEYKDEEINKIIKDFTGSLDTDLENGLILKYLKDVTAEQNLAFYRIKEVFSHATYEQKLMGLIRVSKVTYAQLREVVIQKVYLSYIEVSDLEKIVKTIWSRIEAIQKTFEEPIKQYIEEHPNKNSISINLPPPCEILSIGKFIKTKTKATEGWGRPRCCILISSETGSIQNFHELAANGDKEGIKKCLELKVDLNARDIYGHTAIYYALKNKHVEIANLLLEQQVIPSHKTSECLATKNNFLHMAVEIGDVTLFHSVAEIFPQLHGKKNKAGKTPLELAKILKRTELVKWYEIREEITVLLNYLEQVEFLQASIMQKLKYLTRIYNISEDTANLFSNEDFENFLVRLNLNKTDERFVPLQGYKVLKEFIEKLDKEINFRLQHNRIENNNESFKNEYDEIINFFTNKLESKEILQESVQELKIFMSFKAHVKDYKDRVKAKKINAAREKSIKTMENTFKGVTENRQSLYVYLGAILYQRNLTQEEHKKNSIFSFFTKSRLAEALTAILLLYPTEKTDQELLEIYQEDLNKQEMSV